MDGQEGRYKGIRKDQGKIIKGTLKQAPLKMRVASIPSKIQNIIYDNHHKSAFGNSQQRFYTTSHQKMQSTPGPGNYNPDKQYTKVQSKKGLGTYASQAELIRFNQKRNWNPGPGNYEMLSTKMRSKSTALLSSHLQQRQIFGSQIKIAKSMPGPGKYELKLLRSFSTANPSFKSQNSRFPIQNSQIVPPVGQYNLEQIKRKVNSLKFASPKAEQKNAYNAQKSFVDNLIGLKQGLQTDVGPGKYNPILLDTKKAFSIKQNNRDRFGKLREEKNEEQIEHKVQVIRQTKAKTSNIPSFVFKSKAKRYQFGQFQSQIVGDPAKYSPIKAQRNSHLINFTNKWV